MNFKEIYFFSLTLSAFILEIRAAIVPVICSNASWTTTGITVAGSSAGTSGSTLALLSGPQDFDVDTNNTVYVIDTGNNRAVSWALGASTGVLVAGQTGTAGSTASLLNSPTSIKYGNGSVFVADLNNYRVQKWVVGASSGSTVAGGNGNGAALNQMSATAFIDIDASTNVYLSDYGNSRITKWAVSATSGTVVAGNNGAGTGLNQMNAQWGIFVDSATNYLYIADRLNERVLQWLSGAASGTIVAGVTGTVGSTATLLNNPGAILFDAAGYMYVLDGSNYRVMRYLVGNTAGTTIVSFSTGTAANQLSGSNFPFLMRFDTTGNIYIGDMGNNRIQKYSITCPTTTTTTTTSTSTSATSTTTTITSTSTTTTRTTTTTSSTSTSTSSATTTSTTSTATTTTTTATSTTTTCTTTTITTSTATTSTSTTSRTTTTSTATTATTATTTNATTNASSADATASNDDTLIKIVAPVAAVCGAAVLVVASFFVVRFIKNKCIRIQPENIQSTKKPSIHQLKIRRPPTYQIRTKKPVDLAQNKNLAPTIHVKVNVI